MANKDGKRLKFFSRPLVISAVLLISFTLAHPVMASVENQKIGTVKKIKITKKDLRWFGDAIFQRECSGKIEKLVAWNAGEEFPSFGIGHFIWYPVGYEGPFEESFPEFLAFVKQRGVKLPYWIDRLKAKGCPWTTREAFYQEINSPRMKSLSRFLVRTMYHQSLFIVHRFKKALPKMLYAATADKKNHIRKQFFRVADSSVKLYALIDYVNFKGEGVRSSERYKNKGWGLLQVLEEMRGSQKGSVALREFARAADSVLTRRVINSPVERNEQRWLNGWKNRVNYYRTLIRYM